MGSPRFRPPKKADGESSPNLYVANCGPAVGLSFDDIASVFSSFGEVKGVYAADDSGNRVIVAFVEEASARAALKTLHGRPCPNLEGRSLHIRYSIHQLPRKVNESVPVFLLASDLNIPGFYLFQDFVTAKEEEKLLASVGGRPWKCLSKRRVQHYGHEFCYETRNINTKEHLGELPSFVSPVLERISSLSILELQEELVVDQLTVLFCLITNNILTELKLSHVNEYPPGVGLSPHIDTHSAFEGLIFSLSLAGPCIMEFRRYSEGDWIPALIATTDKTQGDSECYSSFSRRAIYLPPRSMLLLSGEVRYAWHHYIPHHKVDMVNGNIIRRSPRRVSFTFRKVRRGPCRCPYPEHCDSQRLLP